MGANETFSKHWYQDKEVVRVPGLGRSEKRENPRHLSQSSEHFTPMHVVQSARETMGAIDLDPATSVLANHDRVNALMCYGAEDNGFLQEWHGRVFLNPPGGSCDKDGVSVRRLKWDKLWSCNQVNRQQVMQRTSSGSLVETEAEIACDHEHAGVQSSQKAWWQKLVAEWEAGRTTQAIFVGFSIEILQTTQVKAKGQLPLEFPMCVPSRRLAYSREMDGKYVVGKSPPHSSVLICLPPLGDECQDAIERFVESFGPIGHVMVPWRWR